MVKLQGPIGPHVATFSLQPVRAPHAISERKELYAAITPPAMVVCGGYGPETFGPMGSADPSLRQVLCRLPGHAHQLDRSRGCLGADDDLALPPWSVRVPG